jgi:N-acetylneuraminate synthase
MKQARLIAEIGCNHMGDSALSKEFISVAKYYCHADVVKFQKRDIPTWAERFPKLYLASHPNPANSYGDTYRAHREFLEFDLEQHRELKTYCDAIGIMYSASVWDTTSAQEIASLDPALIKVPSAANTNTDMLLWLCDNYQGEIHLSIGMTTRDEIEKIVSLFKDRDRAKDLVLYHCTSGYPVAYQDTCLLEIVSLIKQYGTTVREIGFSGHHIGIAVDAAAYTLGATTIERHFTLDKHLKGTDHLASLEPHELRQLKMDLEALQKSLNYKQEDILPVEAIQRKKLKWQ